MNDAIHNITTSGTRSHVLKDKNKSSREKVFQQSLDNSVNILKIMMFKIYKIKYL